MTDFSGKAAKIYSVIIEDDTETVFERFFSPVKETHPVAWKKIIDLLFLIVDEGAQKKHFRYEGRTPADGVEALWDRPEAELRLYCIRFDETFVILSSGGPKKVKAWQDDPVLTRYAKLMLLVSKAIRKAFEDGELYWTKKGLRGKLKYGYDDEEEE